jgi:hypothetical protein
MHRRPALPSSNLNHAPILDDEFDRFELDELANYPREVKSEDLYSTADEGNE